MKNRIACLLVMVVLAFVAQKAPAADRMSGSMTVSATIVGSITMSVDSPAAVAVDANTVTVPVHVGADGSVSRGFDAQRTMRGWLYSTPVFITVHQANVQSDGYSVLGYLQKPAAAGTEFAVNGMPVSASAVTPVTTAAAFDERHGFVCSVSLSDEAATREIDNAFVLTIVTK